MIELESGKVKKPIRIAFVAHELSPYQGSECAGGWKLLLQLTERFPEFEIDVFCADGPQQVPGKYAQDVQRWLNAHGNLSRVNFFHLPYDGFARRLIAVNFSFGKLQAGIGNPFLYFLAYRLWQLRVMKAVSEQHQDQPYDVLHIVNLITLREPGYWKGLDIPMVWGPTGGVSSVPWGFLRSLPLKVQLQELIRQLSWSLPSLRKLRIKQTMRKARHVFFFDRREANSLGSKGKASVLADSACGPAPHRARNANDALHIIVVGQLVHRKMPSLLLHALARLPELAKTVKVSYIGSGPLEGQLKDLVLEWRLDNVHFKGNLEHSAMNEIYSSADLMVHSSFREAGSHVIPEALSAGVPIICHAVGGLDYFVDDSCGVLLPLVDEESSISGIAQALSYLSNDRLALDRLSQGAIARARDLGWPTMADKVAAVYRTVITEVAQ